MPNQPKKNSAPAKVKRITNRQRTNIAASHCRVVANQLSEHLSSVQIVGTILHPNGTTGVFRYGSGDLLARIKASEVFLGFAYQSLMENDNA